MVIKETPDVGGEKCAERLFWACKFMEEACKRSNKKLTDFEFMQLASKLGETMFVRSELGRGNVRE